jgi:hypothetical protein
MIVVALTLYRPSSLWIASTVYTPVSSNSTGSITNCLSPSRSALWELLLVTNVLRCLHVMLRREVGSEFQSTCTRSTAVSPAITTNSWLCSRAQPSPLGSAMQTVTEYEWREGGEWEAIYSFSLVQFPIDYSVSHLILVLAEQCRSCLCLQLSPQPHTCQQGQSHY